MSEKEKALFKSFVHQSHRDGVIDRQGKYVLVRECYVNPDPRCDPREKSIYVLNIRGKEVFDDKYGKFENGAWYTVQDAWNEIKRAG